MVPASKSILLPARCACWRDRRRRRPSVELEHFAEPALSLLPSVRGWPLVAITVAIAVAIAVAVPVPTSLIAVARLAALVLAAIEDLVELTPVEPDATALRAVVDLDALALGYQQCGPVYRTKHHTHLLDELASVYPKNRVGKARPAWPFGSVG